MTARPFGCNGQNIKPWPAADLIHGKMECDGFVATPNCHCEERSDEATQGSRAPQRSRLCDGTAVTSPDAKNDGLLRRYAPRNDNEVS
jgi:hypothetical protein